jgi:PAS domain S-box-containing protein
MWVEDMANQPTTRPPRIPRVTRALLEAAVASASNGIVLADASLPDLPLVFVNPAFERITGYSAREALGENCRFLQGTARRQKRLETLREALAAGTRCNVVLKNFRKDGTMFWNELYVAPLRDAQGRVTHFVGVQNDVTRRVEAERAGSRLRRQLRERNRELERLDAEKNALLGMAAHDIRNPLTTILLNAAILKGDAARPPGPEACHRAVGRIRDSAGFMLELVNELLDVTKIESGSLSLDRKPLDIAALLRERLPPHRQSAAAKRIEIRSRCEGGLPPAYADRARIAQVLDNLVSNAVKFSHPDTTVRVRAARAGDDIAVSVSDEGQGVPPEEQARLFQPFARTSVRGTAGEPSTGLGLAICRKIVKAHDGRIGVESTAGKGSTFHFTLPAAGRPSRRRSAP